MRTGLVVLPFGLRTRRTELHLFALESRVEPDLLAGLKKLMLVKLAPVHGRRLPFQSELSAIRFTEKRSRNRSRQAWLSIIDWKSAKDAGNRNTD